MSHAVVTLTKGSIQKYRLVLNVSSDEVLSRGVKVGRLKMCSDKKTAVLETTDNALVLDVAACMEVQCPIEAAKAIDEVIEN